MKDFKGKVAVVTGAASGIGKALAVAFAKRGAALVLADIEPAPLKAAEREIAALGAAVLSRVTDVSKRESVMALAEAAYEQFPSVHIVCNNAGVATWGGLESARHEDWQWLLGVNLWGVIHGCEAFLPRMTAQAKQGQLGEGHIVNTASMAGLIASKGLGIYNTTKYAVVGLSETLQKDLRDYRIGVSVLCPMGVTTRIRDSERNRPAELKRPRAEGSATDLIGQYIPAERAAALVLACIEANQLYVVTHPESEPALARRFERIREAYAFLKGK
jgi:NAD(P)-dependent dehydrogenase (short-subunit alcohol dehydrogenase family)